MSVQSFKPQIYCLLAMLGMLSFQPQVLAQIIFQDSFNGPSMNPVWQTIMPSPGALSGGAASTNYLGAPAHSFQTISGSSTLRLSNTMNDHQRRGWSTSTIFNVDSFQLDLRFNTLVQSAATSIDAFVELWLIDPANLTRYNLTSPYGGNNSATKSLAAGGTIDNQYTSALHNYTNNTWYHLQFLGSQSTLLQARITDDNGNILFNKIYNHSLSAFPNGFQIGVSQALGTPGEFAPLDVAIDSVTLSAVPEPSSLLTGAAVIISAAFIVIKRRRARAELDAA